MIKFVGYRGYERVIPRGHARGSTYVLDITGSEHEGEVFPKPIVPVTKVNRENLERLTGERNLGRQYFIGILEYEVSLLTLKYTLRNAGFLNQLVLMSRGVGKTYCEDWEGAFGMKWFKEKLLLLSESDAMLKVGNWVYTWAFSNHYLIGAQRHAKQSTYQHFTLVNGAQLDIYKYMDKRTVGMHDIRLVGDDIVNLDWRNRPSDDQRARDHFASNLNHMIRTGLDLWGTRKYEGDLLQYFMETIEDLVVIKMSPFIECPHGNINAAGTYDPCPICRDLCLLSPEIHSYDEYMQKMEEDYESWYAEQMQDPHPRAGGMVEEEDIYYESLPTREAVRVCGIGVDTAQVWDESRLSDMTAVVSCLMWGEQDERKQEHRRFTFMKADVGRMPIRSTVNRKGKLVRGIIETIDKHWRFFRKHYPDKQVIIAIERSANGIALIDQILREDWPWKRNIVADKGQAVKWTKEGRTNVPLGIVHKAEKIMRIQGELRHSIKKNQLGFHQTSFTHNLEDTVLMMQLLSFPKGKHDDGPDAAGMIKDELNRRWSKKGVKREAAVERQFRKEAKLREAVEERNYPWLGVQRRAASAARKSNFHEKKYGFHIKNVKEE